MVSMTMEQNSKRFCPPSHGRLGAELELAVSFACSPSRKVGEAVDCRRHLQFRKCLSPGRQAHFHHGTYVRIGPQVGSRVRTGPFKALRSMWRKTWVFSAPGITTRMGQCPQNGQGTGLWYGFLCRDSRGSVFTPVLSICKKCKCKLAKQGQALPGEARPSRQRVSW